MVCSKADPASLNIYERLLERQTWQPQDGYWSWDRFCLLIHNEKQTALSGFDGRLDKLGLDPDVVILASRHEAKAALPWFGGHFTGLLEGEKTGLAQAAPSALRSFLHNIQSLAPPGYAVSAEATHHGPLDARVPSFFAEIGSTGREWQDRHAGTAAAKAILAVREKELAVFLGFGGGHYVPRQTDLMAKAAISFGHLFSSYQIHAVDEKAIKEARERSKADYAYIDRKSLRSEERKRIEALLADEGLPILRSREIIAKFPLPEKERQIASSKY